MLICHIIIYKCVILQPEGNENYCSYTIKFTFLRFYYMNDSLTQIFLLT